jgi:hypothetical protein
MSRYKYTTVVGCILDTEQKRFLYRRRTKLGRISEMAYGGQHPSPHRSSGCDGGYDKSRSWQANPGALSAMETGEHDRTHGGVE